MNDASGSVKLVPSCVVVLHAWMEDAVPLIRFMWWVFSAAFALVVSLSVAIELSVETVMWRVARNVVILTIILSSAYIFIMTYRVREIVRLLMKYNYYPEVVGLRLLRSLSCCDCPELSECDTGLHYVKTRQSIHLMCAGCDVINSKVFPVSCEMGVIRNGSSVSDAGVEASLNSSSSSNTKLVGDS